MIANQFAYTRGRGARDAIAYLVMTWLFHFTVGRKLALYCSDVAGAFDRVCRHRLLNKLKHINLHPQLIKVFEAWLDERIAYVIVNGQASCPLTLINMVFQGTMLGPISWNIFYADSNKPIRDSGFTDTTFADDLNAWKQFEAPTPKQQMLEAMTNCQKELHAWGKANQVLFDCDKEHMLILNRQKPHGQSFKLLGVDFDCKLVMSDAVYDLTTKCKWKLKAILQTQKFNTNEGLINLYKAQILSYIEYRTAAIYHACSMSLAALESFANEIVGSGRRV